MTSRMAGYDAGSYGKRRLTGLSSNAGSVGFGDDAGGA